MLEFFSVFLKDAASRFKRIARSVRGHIKPDELHTDAWIVAAEIAEKRGREIDFSDPADQELVLNRVYWNVKDQRDWRLEAAYSIHEDREGTTPWADRLTAPISASPLEILLSREAAATDGAALAASYTQAAAYDVVLTNFNSNRPKLCAHLLITDRTLEDRMSRALEVVRRQESLFNGHQTIDRDFVPPAGRRLLTVCVFPLDGEQAELPFH